MERYETQIEILISDNASADGTADLVNKYQKHNSAWYPEDFAK